MFCGPANLQVRSENAALEKCFKCYVCTKIFNLMFRKINSFSKDILLYSRLFYVFYPFRKFFLFLYNFSGLTVWISKNTKKIDYNDFLKPARKYTDRVKGF